MLTRCGRQHKLTAMDVAQLGEAATGTDPDSGLRAVAALRALVERLEAAQIESARAQGWSWQDIAARLGVTKQTVHRKYRSRKG